MKKTRSKKSRDTVPLKVLSNEKRGGLTMVFFVRSFFKLFMLKYSNKSVHFLSFERPKTAQRTLFLYYLKTIIVSRYSVGGL